MANQIVVSSGAKVRDLNDVIIGTSGVLSSLAFNVANGVPKLDVNGKILVSQLPNSVMEYQGTWNAATNTPTLVNGTGNQGDVYLCNVAGTTNFGAGPITFAVGDSAIYSGTIWQRAGGATGTVTSVGLTSTGNDAITITGSPITTSGNINLGFAGTNLQYINGAGDLTTFPTLISSIGLSMPSAFSVANSPLTSNGTIAVTGAGYPSQYIRGDGTLADFPTSGGGGSSVSYYLNGGTSQGTIGGVTYYEMSKTADTGTMADFSLTGNGFIVAFLTDAGDPAQLNIPAGNWNYEIYASMSANGGTPEMYAELYKYDGTTFTLIATSPHEILYDGTALNLYTFAMTVPSTTLAITDRLAVKLYATNSGGKTTTVHTQDSHLCQIITTFSTGITALNGLTAQVQYFATGTSGTDFAISSTTATHTFNLPVASASNTGKLSSTDWSTFNGKVPYTGAIANVDLGGNDLSGYYINGTQLTAKKVGSTGGALFIETGSGYVVGGVSGIAMASGSANNLSLFFIDATATNTKNAILNFGSLTNNTNRTYTLPDASGTLALTSDLGSYVTLATTQTISGAKTFSNPLTADKGVILATGSTTFLAGSTTLNGNANGLTIGLGVTISGTTTNYAHQLLFPQLTPQTYTYPAASGTLALTSDLGSYVPLAGNVNITGPLGINTTGGAGTTGLTNFGTFITRSDSTQGFPRKLAISMASGTLVSIDASGNGANYITDMAFSTSTASGINATPAIYITGTNNRVGIKTGTPAYDLDVSGTGRFTSTLNANALNLGGGTISGVLYAKTTTDYNFRVTSSSGIGRLDFLNDANSTYQSFSLGNSWMTFSSAGNVGIGVTPSSWSTANSVKALQNYAGSFWNYNDNNLYVGLNYYWDGSNRRYISSVPASEYQQNGDHIFFTAPTGTAGNVVTFTERMRITNDGYLRLASKGIQFNGDTSDANSLDDYEEGTWTPVVKLGNTTNTASTSVGVYTKIGRVVYIQCTILDITKSGSGDLSITGLPFTIGSAATFGNIQGNLRWGGITSAGFISPYFSANSAIISMQGFGSTGYSSNVTDGACSATYQIYGVEGFYMV